MCGGGADLGPKIFPNGDSQNSGYQGMVRQDRAINALPGIKSMQAAPEYSYQGDFYDKATNSFQQAFTAPTEKVSRTAWLSNKDSAELKVGDSFTEANAFGANGKITGITANNMVGTNSKDEVLRSLKENDPAKYAQYTKLAAAMQGGSSGVPGGTDTQFLYNSAYNIPGQLITYEFDSANRSKVANNVYNEFNRRYTEAATGDILGPRFNTNDEFNSTNDAARFINSGNTNQDITTKALAPEIQKAGSSEGFNYAAPKAKVRKAPNVLNSSPTGGSSGAGTTGE